MTKLLKGFSYYLPNLRNEKKFTTIMNNEKLKFNVQILRKDRNSFIGIIQVLLGHEEIPNSSFGAGTVSVKSFYIDMPTSLLQKCYRHIVRIDTNKTSGLCMPPPLSRIIVFVSLFSNFYLLNYRHLSS